MPPRRQIPALPEEEKEEGPAVDGAASVATAPTGNGGDGFLSGTIPRIVYKQACEAFPQDPSLPARFLQVYRLFPGTSALREDLYAGLPETAAGLALRARRPLDDRPVDAPDLEGEQAVAALLQARDLFFAALETHPSEEL